MTENFFCIDLGETSFRIAQLTKKGPLFEAQSLGILDIDPIFFRTESERVIENTAQSLVKLLKQLKIHRKYARVVIPDGYSFNQFVDMPLLNEKELLSALKYQADQFIPMSLDEVNLDVEIIYEDKINKRLLTLVSASSKKFIEKIAKLLEYSTLIPESIEPEVSAVGRLTAEIFKSTQEKSGVLLVNMGYSTTSVYFFDQTLGLLTFSHNFPIGYNLFLKEIQINLNIDVPKSVEILKTFGVEKNSSQNIDSILSAGLKDFIGEIEKTMNQLKSKNYPQVKRIYLFNDSLKFPSVDELLGRYFGLPAENINLYSAFAKNNIVDYFKNDLSYFFSGLGTFLR